MTIAQGVNKQTRFKRQTAKGTIATPGTGGQIIRRKSSVFELAKETYTTEDEINSSQQLMSSRHGNRQVNGQIDGILSPGTYTDMLSALLRRDFTAGPTSGALTTVTAASTGATTGTFTRSAGSWLSDGFKIGMVCRHTGWATTGATNNSKNLMITALTATVMTVITLDGSAIGAKAAGDSVTVAMYGKLTYVPTSGHTSIYYTVEEWFPDAPYSERNQDCKVASADLKLPGSGNAEVGIAMVGLDQSNNAAVYFTAPTTETTSESLTAAGGALYLNGTGIATVTDLSFKVDGKEAPADGVVGTNLRPDIFRGKVMVSGSFTAYFEDGTIPSNFVNETDCSILVALTNGASATADFMTIYLAKLNLNTNKPDDGETGLKRTYDFVAELNSAGGTGVATEKTSLWIQDSLA